MTDISQLRQEYASAALTEQGMAEDPLEQFTRWFEQAQQADVLEPNAMTLATCGPDGVPQARIVLLKGVDPQGFVFYTSYLSAKAAELRDNPQASLCFWWDKLQRQVRVVGEVTRVSRAESEQYFASRPHRSQLGAWASEQSRPVASREVLEQRFAELDHQYQGEAAVPTPPFWGGFRVHPRQVEFWQGQRSRLHDRLLYTRQPDGTWAITRLSP